MVDLNRCLEKLEKFKILEERELKTICDQVGTK
jgi:hypothetical protein